MNTFKTLLLAGTISLSAFSLNSAQAADVGVSVSIGQPGFYGRIDIGDYPQPELVYAEPVIIHRPVGVVYDPIYLHVPPGHAKRWSHYCGQYNACGRPVYFVQDRWYNDVYVPHYHEHHGEGNRGHYDDRDGDHGHRQDGDDRGYRHGHDREH